MNADATQRFFNHRPWLRRLALAVTLAVFGSELVYVLVANTILGTNSLDRWVTGATPGLSLKIESGWSLWPGRVHVKRVELHFEDYNIQFSVSLDTAVIDIRLWQLATKTLHFTRVRAEGVHYLLRHKVSSSEGIERRLALYPRIAGFSEPPLFRGPKAPPLTDAQYNLWTIHLEDVDAGVKELWFLEYRFTGAGRAQGGFRLEPQRDAYTDPCSLTLDGVLRVGAQTVASRLRGRIEAQLDRHDPRVVVGKRIFTKISFDTDLRAAIAGLEFTELYTEAHGAHLSGGMGTLQVRAKLSHGAWIKPTRLRYETAGLTCSRDHLVVSGALSLGANMAKGGRGAVLKLSAESAQLSLFFKGSTKPAAAARDVHAISEVSSDLAREFRLLSLAVRLKAHAPELRRLNYPVSAKELFRGGSGRVNAALGWKQGEPASGRATFEVTNAQFDLGHRPMRVSGSLNAVLSYDPTTERGRFRRLGLELPELAVLVDNAWIPLRDGLHVHAQPFTWHGLRPDRFQGRLELHSETIAPFLPLIISSGLLRSIAKPLFHLGKMHAIVEVERTPAAFVLRLEESLSGDVRATGILMDESDQEHPCGRFFVTSTDVSLGIVLYRGETSLRPFVSANWWRERPPTTSCGPVLTGVPKIFADSTRTNATRPLKN